jgi:putative transposase
MVALKLIQAGKPTQNTYIESFNGKFRDECLNEHWFMTLAHARAAISAWRRNRGFTRSNLALLKEAAQSGLNRGRPGGLRDEARAG